MKRTGPVKMKDAIKRATDDQDKIFLPQETVVMVKQRMNAMALKILDQTMRIDNGRLDIPVFFSTCGHDAQAVIGTKKQMGKGATPAQAEASAVMELAERFSFFSFYANRDHTRLGTVDQFAGEAIAFDQIAKSVHDESGDLDVARRIFESLPLRWTGAWNLTREKDVLIPLDWFFAINAFNGPSAGNCVEEALCQGICEIVERHVSSMISRRQISTPLIDPASATDRLVREMLGKYDKAGIKVFITDFTQGMGIPSVGVLAYYPVTFPGRSEIVWTAGTTPNPEKALSRALTEVAQLAGDFNSGSTYVASGLPKFTRLEDADYVINAPGPISLANLPDLSQPNIRREVEACIQALAQRDFEVLVVDTTHPQLAVPAFYTIVPGAHFRERAAGTSVAMFAAKITMERFGADEAIKRLTDMERLLPGKYFIQFYLGNCHLERNDPQTALRHLARALELSPAIQDIPSIYAYMGVCHKELGDYETALAVLAKGEALDPERTDIHNLKGFCHFMRKEHEAAIQSFETVIALDPSSAIDYANIASNYRDMGKKTDAVHYYRLALALDPSIDFARDNLERLTGKTEDGGPNSEI
ncbi:MAG: YcaO-like family protein [Desulfobacteraceae bacterium]|jgi:ribosomal protein S12 methylthiotransferase accessory factor|nr:YcaO-like family protein [Desulfobacteraceae bacterium]